MPVRPLRPLALVTGCTAGRPGPPIPLRPGPLPAHERACPREHTVETPGSRDRGARRVVTGRGDEIYYTDDHYDTFRAVLR
ncbi:guanyl-specific ribonuclease Sa [Streptomyces sp. 3330]|nr:guanyl-specific ribonuclease Sa [Streptomyces sp. 3330]